MQWDKAADTLPAAVHSHRAAEVDRRPEEEAADMSREAEVVARRPIAASPRTAPLEAREEPAGVVEEARVAEQRAAFRRSRRRPRLARSPRRNVGS